MAHAPDERGSRIPDVERSSRVEPTAAEREWARKCIAKK